MNVKPPNQSIKVIGANGQISLGKEFAGRQVLVEECEPGVWLIRTAIVLPENEYWLHQPQTKRDLAEALNWSINNKPQESDPSETLRKLENAKKTGRRQGKT